MLEIFISSLRIFQQQGPKELFNFPNLFLFLFFLSHLFKVIPNKHIILGKPLYHNLEISTKLMSLSLNSKSIQVVEKGKIKSCSCHINYLLKVFLIETRILCSYLKSVLSFLKNKCWLSNDIFFCKRKECSRFQSTVTSLMPPKNTWDFLRVFFLFLCLFCFAFSLLW